MKILNLGCGGRTSDQPNVTNIDFSMYLRLKKIRWIQPMIPLVLTGDRYRKYQSLPDNIMVHDLAKGIPFDSESVDVVYHSHMLEHLDRDIAREFIREVGRVLKPGGIHRIVVPDFERLCQAYLSHLAECDRNRKAAESHDNYIADIIEQSVRKKPFSTRGMSPIRSFLEMLFLGDARKRGETHQWMYDRINLKVMLLDSGFKDVSVHEFNTSRIPDWNRYGLDNDGNDHPYKPESLYIEAVK